MMHTKISDSPITRNTSEWNANFERGREGTYYTFVWHKTDGTDNLYRPFAISNVDENNADFESIARDMKEHYDKLPDGKRAFNPFHFLAPIRKLRDNYIWLERGVEGQNRYFDKLIEAYKAIGGKDIDLFMFDTESALNVYYLEAYVIKKRETWDTLLGKIESDPRYASEIRPQLIEEGIELYTEGDHPEMWNMAKTMNEAPSSPAQKNVYRGINWANKRMTKYMNQIFANLKKHYPNCMMSDYGFVDMCDCGERTSAYGHRYGMFSAPVEKSKREYTHTVGTHGSWSNYGAVRASLINNPPPQLPYDKFPTTPFYAVMSHVMDVQYAIDFRDDAKIQPWMSNWNFTYGGVVPYVATDYYDELVYHFGLAKPDPFLFYNYETSEYSKPCNIHFSELLHDLDDLCGFEDRKPIINIPKWTDHYLLSGMTAGGKNVWRITPDLSIDGMTIENFKVSDAPLTFEISGQKIVFPKGSFIFDHGEGHSRCGYWVISPVDTYPTVTEDKDVPFPPMPEYKVPTAAEANSMIDEIVSKL